MAVGDAFAVILGTATTNRQPAVGVEEQVSNLAIGGSTDRWQVYDGTNTIDIIPTGSAGLNATARNMAMMITNSVYLRKSGTADRGYAGGVQTNV